MCITKPRRRVKPLLVPSSRTGISLPSALWPQGSHSDHAAATSKTDESKIPSLLVNESEDKPKHVSPLCVPCVVGSSSSESSLSTFGHNDSWASHSIVTNDTPEILASSPGSKILDDSWPTLDAVFDEIEVQKSQLEAERSFFGLAATEAEHRCATAETKSDEKANDQGAKITKKRSPKKLKHDYRDVPVYHDRSCEPTIDSKKPSSKRVSFPLKLHRVLSEIEADGLSDIIGWQPHGRAFMVHDTDRFRSEILPRYFDNAKPATYLRQLNLYGFQRLRKGGDRDGYYHECFLKGREDLTGRMSRTRIKGTGVRQASNPEMEPNFYRMKPVGAASNVPREEEEPRFHSNPIDMGKNSSAAIIQPSPELSATSLIAQDDVLGNISEHPSSSAMYDAYLETSPPIVLPPVSGKAFLEKNAASFVKKSTHCAVVKDASNVPPLLPPTPYQCQVSDDVPMEEDSKPAAMRDTLDELDTFFDELDQDLAFLADEGQANHLEDDVAFGHLLDQMVGDI